MNISTKNIGRVFFIHVVVLVSFCSYALAAFSTKKYPPVDKMIGQMIMVGFRGADIQEDATLIAPVLDAIQQGKVGGVILFDKDILLPASSRNIHSIEQLKTLTEALQKKATIPLFIAIDQEGGHVQRLKVSHGVSPTPSAEEMGKLDPLETKAFATKLANSFLLCGINVNFAPSFDVNINSKSPVIGALARSFSKSPKTVELHGKAFAEGMSESGIIPAYKHFPGHGSAMKDSHLGFTDITNTWQKEEITPYRGIIKEYDSAMVMVGHLVNKHIDEKYPASLSYATITKLLRKGIGWKGVVISDDLNMDSIRTLYSEKEAILLAINAGEDILLIGNNLAYDPLVAQKTHMVVMELVAKGKISKERIYKSYKRILELKKKIE